MQTIQKFLNAGGCCLLREDEALQRLSGRAVELGVEDYREALMNEQYRFSTKWIHYWEKVLLFPFKSDVLNMSGAPLMMYAF